MSNKKPLSSEQKDYIISSLKGELYQYHQNQVDFDGLHNQLSRLENTYKQQSEEMQRLQKAGRLQTETDLCEIKQLRGELEYLQDQLRQRLPNQNPQLLELANIRSEELAQLKQETNELLIQQEQLQEERVELEGTMKQLIESKNQLEEENGRLRKEYERQFKQNKESEQTRQDLEYEITKKEKIQQQQRKTLDSMSKEYKQKNDYLEQLKLKKQLSYEQSNQITEQYEQQKEYFAQISNEHQVVQKNLNQCIQEQKESYSEYLNLDNEIKQVEQDAEIVLNHVDEENLKKLNLIEDQKFLTVEMNRALDIIQQLTGIKSDVNNQFIQLCNEITIFMNEDEQISNILDRKKRQTRILEQSQQLIEESQSKNMINVI